MSTQLLMIKDVYGNNSFGLPFSTQNYSTTLLANVAQALTVPAATGVTKYLAVFAFEPGAKVWVANNATAAKPGASFATSTSTLNPVARVVTVADVLNFITGDTSVEVGVSFYAI